MRKASNLLFIHICPECKKEIIFKDKFRFDAAEKELRKCRSCRQIVEGLIRLCPKCNSKITYRRIPDYNWAIKHQTLCLHCSENSGKFKKGIRNFEFNNNKSTIPKYSLDRLLDNSLESMYWIGVILADGNVYKNRFEISFKESDLEFLLRLTTYLNIPLENIKYRSKTKSNRLAFSNRYSILKFKEVLDINEAKTYNPPDFNFYKLYSKDLLTALLIGLIDGDGHIDKQGLIGITAHCAWEQFYIELLTKLDFPIRISYPSKSILRIGIYQKYYIQTLKNFIYNHNLLILNRKWNRIQLGPCTK